MNAWVMTAGGMQLVDCLILEFVPAWIATVSRANATKKHGAGVKVAIIDTGLDYIHDVPPGRYTVFVIKNRTRKAVPVTVTAAPYAEVGTVPVQPCDTPMLLAVNPIASRESALRIE